MVESAREQVCGSMRVGGKNLKRVWWNNEIKAVVRRKRLLGRRCWQQVVKRQKKDVWKCTERRREYNLMEITMSSICGSR